MDEREKEDIESEMELVETLFKKIQDSKDGLDAALAIISSSEEIESTNNRIARILAKMDSEEEAADRTGLWQKAQRLCGAYDLYLRHKEQIDQLRNEVELTEGSIEAASRIINFLKTNSEIIHVKNKSIGASATLCDALAMAEFIEKKTETREKWQRIQRLCGAYDLLIRHADEIIALKEYLSSPDADRIVAQKLVEYLKLNPSKFLKKSDDKQQLSPGSIAEMIMMHDVDEAADVTSNWKNIGNLAINYCKLVHFREPVLQLLKTLKQLEGDPIDIAFKIIDWEKENSDLLQDAEQDISINPSQIATILYLADEQSDSRSSIDWDHIGRLLGGYRRFQSCITELNPLLEQLENTKGNKKRASVIANFVQKQSLSTSKVHEEGQISTSSLTHALMMAKRNNVRIPYETWQTIQRLAGAMKLFEKQQNILEPLLDEVKKEDGYCSQAYKIIDFLKTHIISMDEESAESVAASTLVDALSMADGTGENELKSTNIDWKSIQIICGAYEYAYEHMCLLKLDLKWAIERVLPGVLNSDRMITQQQYDALLKQEMLHRYGNFLSSTEDLKKNNFPYRHRKNPIKAISNNYYRRVRDSFFREMKEQGKL